MSRQKVCIVTGANSGIGKAAAEQISDSGHRVVLACRSVDRGEAAKAEIAGRVPHASLDVVQVDMGVRGSIETFSRVLAERYPTIDVVIHNAAIFDVTRKTREVTEDGVETVWAVNHVGPVLLTELLLPRILAAQNGRIVTVSSKGLLAMPRLKVDLNDPEFENRRFSVIRAYYQAKRAQEIYTWWLADRLKDQSVTANCVRVTAVKVDLSRHPDISGLQRWAYAMKSRMSLSPEEMARTYTWLATADEAGERTGCYFDEKHAEVNPAPYTREASTIRAVMELTARYVPEIGEVVDRVAEVAD